MKKLNFTKTIAILFAVFALAFTASAQQQTVNLPTVTVNTRLCIDWKTMQYRMFERTYYIYYGCSAYAGRDFRAAADKFKEGLEKYSDDAELWFYLGNAYVGGAAVMPNKNSAEYKSMLEKARDSFQRAARLDRDYEKKINDALGIGDEEEGVSNDGIRQPPFREGDEVEVKDHGSDEWIRGTIVSIEDQGGDGTRFVYKVRYRSVADWVEYSFYGDRVRAVTSKSDSPKQPTKATGEMLFYADYVCTEDYFAGGQRRSENRGVLSLKAGGTYSFRGTSGRYKYNAATSEIIWLSGYLSADKNTTKFRRNQNTAQIDITLKTASGDLDWSCGANLK